MKTILKIDPKIYSKKIEELFHAPKILRVTEFDEKSLDHFAEDMDEAQNTGQPVIPIVIDSYGGQAYALTGMLSIMDSCKIPIATICQSKAMSCGAILFAYGTEGYRFMDPYATLMIHDVAAMSFGKVEELKSATKQCDLLNNLVYARMAKNIGKEEDYILKLITQNKHADLYLSAKEAKKHNLTNHLRIPEFEIEMKLNINFK
jgi:ATP-dependent Clp endopeptidase proteolytic subunit ClpP